MRIDPVPGDPGHDGVRYVLDRYGESAVAIEAELRRVGEHAISMRLFIIAQALREMYLEGAAAVLTGDDRRDETCLGTRGDRGG